MNAVEFGSVYDARSRRGTLALAILVHVLVLVLPQAPTRLRPATPAREREQPEPLRVLRPEEIPQMEFGDDNLLDDEPSPAREAPPADQPPPAAVARVPPVQAPPEVAMAEPTVPPVQPPPPPEIPVPTVPAKLPTPVPPTAVPSATPPPTRSPTPTQSPRPTTAAPTAPPVEQVVETAPRPEPPAPTPPDNWFEAYNRERRMELALADEGEGNAPSPPVENAVPGERYRISRDGSLTVYVGEGRRGTRCEIDLTVGRAKAMTAVNQALAPFGGSYWEGYRESVSWTPRPGEQAPVISGVSRGGQRLRPVTQGGPGYYIVIDWGDEQKLGRHLEQLVNQALKDRGIPDDAPLRRVVVGIRLHEQKYEFYVQTIMN